MTVLSHPSSIDLPMGWYATADRAATEQIGWWRSQGVTCIDVSEALGMGQRASWPRIHRRLMAWSISRQSKMMLKPIAPAMCESEVA